MKKQILETGDRSIKQKVGGGQGSAAAARVDPRRLDYDTANGIGYPKKTVIKTNSGPHGVNKVKDKEPVNVSPSTQTVNYDPFGHEISDDESKGPNTVNTVDAKADVQTPQLSQADLDSWRQETIDRILKLAGMDDSQPIELDDRPVGELDLTKPHNDNANAIWDQEHPELTVPKIVSSTPVKALDLTAGDDDANAEWDRLHPTNEELQRIRKLSGLK